MDDKWEADAEIVLDIHSGEPVPPILYKYFPPPSETRPFFLTDRLIRLTQPNDLNDPFEFSPNARRIIGSNSKKRIAEELIETLRDPNSIYEMLLKSGKVSPLQNPKIVIKDIKSRLAGIAPIIDAIGPNADALVGSEIFQLLETNPFAEPLKKFGVLSLTEDHLNPVMWAHYAQDYTGYVIGFDAFHSFFMNKNTGKSALMKVQYTDVLREDFLDVNDSPKNFFAQKRTYWSYEREWRVVRSREEAHVELHDGKISLFEIPADAVAEIIFFPRKLLMGMADIASFKVCQNPQFKVGFLKLNTNTAALEISWLSD